MFRKRLGTKLILNFGTVVKTCYVIDFAITTTAAVLIRVSEQLRSIDLWPIDPWRIWLSIQCVFMLTVLSICRNYDVSTSFHMDCPLHVQLLLKQATTDATF